MKKILLILIPSILLALVVVLIFQSVMQSQTQKGALQVTSAPDSKVYLNDKYLGQTPLCKCEEVDMLQAGDYTIRLVPIDKSLTEFQEKITITESVLTVVDRKFGKDSLSEGSVISLSPLADKKKIELLVVSFPEGSTVWLDNNIIGETPILYKNPTESDHVLRVSKKGYKEKSIRIRTTAGYKLTVAVYLSTTLDPQSTTPEEPVASASAEPDLPVSPTAPQESVTILDTPTGFLRVRASSSVGGAEIGRVTPGESFPVVSEKTGWFEIQLKDGTNGWISSQYARK